MHSRKGKERGLLVLLGFLSLGVYSCLTQVSGQFTVELPVPLSLTLSYLLLYGVAFLFYMGAVRIVVRMPFHKVTLFLLLGFALAFRGLLLFSHPILSNDFYRYMWDGAVVASGGNPYQYTPQKVIADPPFRAIVTRINHPDVPTIYPPLAQGVFALAAILAPANLMALRLLFILFDMGTAFLLIPLLRHLGQSPLLVLLYAWSPLVIKEVANSAHYDPVPTFFVVLAALLLTGRRYLLGHAGLALGILSKLYPLFLLPIFSLKTYKEKGGAATICGLLLTFVVFGTAYLPFIDAGPSLWKATSLYAQYWEDNSFLFPLLHRVLGDRFSTTLVVAGFPLALAVFLVHRSGVRDDRKFLYVFFLLIAALFLFSPTGYPWYSIWFLPFLCLSPSLSWLLLTGLLGLYYLSFSLSPQAFHGIIWLEYLPFYAVLLWEVWRKETNALGRVSEEGTVAIL